MSAVRIFSAGPLLACRDRAAVLGRANCERLQDMAAQASAVGVADVGNPALDAGVEFVAPS
ncbi:MAG: hypothetical protein ACXW36_10980, partial [Nitrospira sp.]